MESKERQASDLLMRIQWIGIQCIAQAKVHVSFLVTFQVSLGVEIEI